MNLLGQSQINRVIEHGDFSNCWRGNFIREILGVNSHHRLVNQIEIALDFLEQLARTVPLEGVND